MATDNGGNTITLSSEPNEAIQEMMNIIDELRSVVVEETTALEASDSKTFLALQDRKMSAAKNYQASISHMMERQDDLKAANESLKRQLEIMRLEFKEITRANLAAIEKMQKGMKRLGDRIMNAARESVKKEQQFVYSADGHMDSSRTATIGVNESA